MNVVHNSMHIIINRLEPKKCGTMADNRIPKVEGLSVQANFPTPFIFETPLKT